MASRRTATRSRALKNGTDAPLFKVFFKKFSAMLGGRLKLVTSRCTLNIQPRLPPQARAGAGTDQAVDGPLMQCVEVDADDDTPPEEEELEEEPMSDMER